MRPRRFIVALSLLIALLSVDIAVEHVGAHAIVDAPNAHKPRPAAAQPGERFVEVGPPPATLAVTVMMPKLPPRAAIFCLHGIRDRKEHIRNWGEHLAEAGYEAILVDSRGHGHSTGDWLTYGVQESRDLSALVDALHVEAPIGVMGVSYGGATAIEWAAREPRVKAAVAVAPFSSLREIVPVYERRTPLVGWMVPPFVIQRSVDLAGRIGHFDPDAASPRQAVTRTHTPMLVIHGRSDVTVPFAESEELAAAAPDHVTLAPLDAQDHDHIAGDPRLWPLALDFFAKAFP